MLAYMERMESLKNQIGNPETDSINEMALELVSEKNANNQIIYKDKNTGEIFHRIGKNPEEQRFISMILKGVMNTADIIKYNGEYYSHQQNIDHLTSNESLLEDEINADKFILSQVFGDGDKKEKVTNMPSEAKESGEWNMGRYDNIAIDQDSNKKYYYDFEAANLGLRHIQNQEDIQLFKKKLTGWPILQKYSPRVEILNKKSKAELDTIFNENNFPLFKAIVEKSNLITRGGRNSTYEFSQSYHTEPMVKELFNDLRNRFQCLYEVTEELKNTKTTPTETGQ